MKTGPSFNVLATKLHRLEQFVCPAYAFNKNYKTLLCLDPGETTGWAVFHCTIKEVVLFKWGQVDTSDMLKGIQSIQYLLDGLDPHILVVEDYRVYGWKTEDHSWSKLHTPKFIGVIYAVAHTKGLVPVMQMAQFAKEFCTDDKLKRWGFYQKGQRHARDAVRHGCAYILFHKK